MIRPMGVYLRNGQWWYRRRVKGRLHRWSLAKLGITNEAQARAYEREMTKARLEDHLARLDPSTRSLGQLRAEYLELRRPLGLSRETLRRDDQALRSLAGHVGQGCLLRGLTTRKVQEWAGHLLAAGVAPTTVNSYLRHIRAALNSAVEWGWLEKPPKLKAVKEPKRLPRALTPEEMDRLLALETNQERRALWSFLLWTGLRRQEVMDMRWQDVHLEGDAPWVRVVGKGDKEGMVPLLPQAVQALETMPRGEVGPVWIFTCRRGKGYTKGPVKAWAATTWFKQAARRAGLEDAHLHDLRHTCGTWMAARGVPERVIQEVLRHASITTTQIYTKGMARMADLYRAMSSGLVSQK